MLIFLCIFLVMQFYIVFFIVIIFFPKFYFFGLAPKSIWLDHNVEMKKNMFLIIFLSEMKSMIY